jgi:hypothetical protein
MKRSKFAIILTLIAVAFLATSCDTLFTNQFKELGLGQISSASLSTAAQNGDSATLIAESGLGSGEISQSFLDAVTSSEDTANKVVAALEAAAADPASPPATVEAAQVLIVQIQLETSGAKTMIDNIVTAIATVDFATFNINNPGDLNSLLAALFPARSGRLALPQGWTSDDVAGIVDVLVSLEDNFASLVANMVGGAYINSGVDAGWLAQVGTFISVMKRLSPVNPAETLGVAVGRLITDFDPDHPESIDPTTYVTIPADLISDLKSDAQLIALFSAAGMDLTSLLAGFGL